MGPFNLKICFASNLGRFLLFNPPAVTTILSIPSVIKLLECLDPFFMSVLYLFVNLLFGPVHSAVYPLINFF